jgi:FixJ family two-component response regulator
MVDQDLVELCRVATARLATLTPRERNVLDLLTQYQVSKNVAYHLDISIKTVECHRRKIMQKMETKSLVELGVMWGRAQTYAAMIAAAPVPHATPTRVVVCEEQPAHAQH